MPIASLNPATGEELQSFEPLSDQHLETKLQLADQAFAAHRETSFSWRAERMRRAAEILESEKDRFGRMMTLEMEKTIRSAEDEAAKCATACRFYADHAEGFLADEEVATGARRSFVRYRPIGPVLAIMPWNFPFWQVVRFAAPALMAGNVGLLKRASNVPQCALALEEIFLRAGFPEGVFQSLLVGNDKVESILADSRIAAATLTGSEGAGVQVGVAAARRIKKVVLELGGSDPFVVMPSADLEEAAATAVKARIVNNGQSCIAAKRFIVDSSIAADFEREFVRRMAAVRVGDPLDPATEMGPLVSTKAVKDLQEQVDKTLAAGARLLTGGRPLGGCYYPATVLADIPDDSPAFAEELFGPVASLFRVDGMGEAIRLANATRFGLGASVWTRDAAEQERFASELEAGMVFFNKMVASDPRVPFGGVKASGHGRELGSFGIREFTNIKTIWME